MQLIDIVRQNMEKEAYIVIGAALGAGATLAASAISGYVQRAIAKTNAQRDLEKERLKFQHDARIKVIERVLARLEDAHVHLSQISQAFDLTGTAIQQSAGTTIPLFDVFYREQCKKLNEVTMLLELYATEAKVDPAGLAGAMNNYWGHYRNLAHQLQQSQQQAAQLALQYVVQYAHEVSAEAYKLRSSINSFARKLNA